MRRHLQKLGIALAALALWPALAQRETHARSARAAEFLIRPYLFALREGGLGLAWQFKATLPAGMPSQVVITKKGEPFATVTAQNDEGLQYVALPLPACGFGEGMAYQVTGQGVPFEVAPIPCAGEGATIKFSFISDTQEGP